MKPSKKSSLHSRNKTKLLPLDEGGGKPRIGGCRLLRGKVRVKNLILLVILLFGLILRLSYLFEFRQTPFFNAQLLSGLDQQTWDENGAAVMNHPWFVDGKPFYQAPGYAYFLAAIYRVFGLHNYLSVGVIQALLDVLAAFLIFLIGKRLWNYGVGLISCFFYCLYRPFIYYSATLLSDSYILFTSVLCLFLVYWTLERPERKDRWLLAGFSFGLATIAKPTILLFLFLSFSFFLTYLSPAGRGKVRGKSLILSFFFFLLGFLLPVAPISIRNSLLAGKLVTVATYGNVNWQIGNSADSIGLFMYPKGPLLSPLSLNFWKLWGRKTFFFFSSYEWPQNLNIYVLTAITNTLKLPLFTFGFIVPLGIVGFFTALNVKFRHLQAYTFAGVASIVAFFITSRYRLPAVAGFILLASGYLYFLFEKTLSLRAQLVGQASRQNAVGQASRLSLVVAKLARRLMPRQSPHSSKSLLLERGINKTKLLPLEGGGKVGVKDLILLLSSFFALAVISFVLVNSWSGPRISEVHIKNYAIMTQKSIEYDRAHGKPSLAQKKIDAFNRFLLQYQSGQIY